MLFSGSAWQAAVEARRLLADDWGVDAEVWSVTSYKSLREDAISVERWNRLHPGEAAAVPFVTEALAGSAGPDRGRHRLHAGRARPGGPVGAPAFTSLGTDGFGRSDTREVLRRFFEVDAAHVVVAVLEGLAADGTVPADAVAAAIGRYGIDAGSPRTPGRPDRRRPAAPCRRGGATARWARRAVPRVALACALAHR